MTDERFDCVEMKRRGADEVQRRISGMTREQELAFWREQTDRLGARQARERARRSGSAPKPTDDPTARTS